MRNLTVLFVALVIASFAMLAIDCVLGVCGVSMAKVVGKEFVPERTYVSSFRYKMQTYTDIKHVPASYKEVMYDGQSTFYITVQQTIFYLDTIGQIKGYRYRKGKWTHYKYFKNFIR
ncbi:MAG: hypothetical protein DI598_19935 [Pseudopedobacter saltans]|uniref:Uncharacterized protein n=1 Tax=Pseudopedobacter saltans TaxID=151895 RepID=A0A2W5EE99_9SPHI|nr:MAG: hypothetical protein DI598_19935 [Pseudopedobacter saltans]